MGELSEGVREWVSEQWWEQWVGEQWVIEWFSQGVAEWVSSWVSEWFSEWVAEWVLMITYRPLIGLVHAWLCRHVPALSAMPPFCRLPTDHTHTHTHAHMPTLVCHHRLLNKMRRNVVCVMYVLMYHYFTCVANKLMIMFACIRLLCLECLCICTSNIIMI